ARNGHGLRSASPYRMAIRLVHRPKRMTAPRPVGSRSRMTEENPNHPLTEKTAKAAREALKDGPSPPKPTVADAAGPGDPPVLECSAVVQRYPNPKGGHQVVLNEVSFVVPQHDFISVVGPSGCGKSTLLRLILGSEQPHSGRVAAAGQSIEHPDRRRGIVFQK